MRRSPFRGRAAALAMMAAVGGWLGCGDLLAVGPPVSTGSCNSDSDCPSGLLCAYGLCRVVCSGSDQCAAGEACKYVETSTQMACVAGTDAGTEDAVADVAADITVPGEAAADAGEAGDGSSMVCPEAGPPTRALLFGGFSANGIESDTWIWNGSDWAQASQPDAAPQAPGRSGAAAWAECGGVMMFGGTTTQHGPYLNDQWWWDGTSWHPVPVTTVPGPRRAAMTLPTSAGVILFGGLRYVDQNPYPMWGDTWLWDGKTWTPLHPAHSPPPRGYAVGASSGATAMIFGGDDGYGNALSDTWVWTGSDWLQYMGPSPPGRYEAQVAGLDGTLVLFGGLQSDGGLLADTWIWNGSAWSQLNPATSPAALDLGAMAGLAGTGVLFGGQDSQGNRNADTWIWNGVTWAEAQTNGPSGRISPALTSF